MLGANVVVGILGSRGVHDGSYDKLHDLVEGKLAGTTYLADFDAESRTPRGPSGWARDRVQHAVATAMAKDQLFAAKVRSLLESMGAKG
ncbi:hypothetical protein KIH74_08640 [Kineosporia sp. J2-2]|uniref:Uncharacterized protein n=1 Tax=Kineosporia corallincola TaxID=2835133 RepID=A0ABS5TD30_9ACTN|nr:hypothetical protein [Kineosporia corallincola]MBT0768991.1 hypothetical protein [Kineosporia corallincola]